MDPNRRRQQRFRSRWCTSRRPEPDFKHTSTFSFILLDKEQRTMEPICLWSRPCLQMQMSFAPYRLRCKFIFALRCLRTLKNTFSLKQKKKILIILNAFKMQLSVMMPSENEKTSFHSIFLRTSFVLRCLSIKIREPLLYFIACI